MECTIQKNVKDCSCTYPCARKGKCCECVSYHAKRGEIPGCFFSKAGERSYDRSTDAFVRDRA